MKGLLGRILVSSLVYLSCFGAQIDSKNYTINARDGNPIEIRNHFVNRKNPAMIFATYAGGNGKRNCIIDVLAEKYNIFAFAPRNSGSLGISEGELTVGNYVSDLEDTIRFTTRENGEKPYGFAMSDMGGYSMGLLISKEPIVKKAVLISPMIDLLEQAPKSKLPWARKELEKETPGWLFRLACACACDKAKDGKGMVFGEQRFEEYKDGGNQIYNLLRSVFSAEKIQSELKSPTKVVLARIDFFGEGINRVELKRRENAWRELGAKEVKTMQSNHWFGCLDDEETGFKGKEAGKVLIESGEIKEIFNFLDSK